MPDGPRHVMLYGPPGAGKLTVAREVERRYEVRVVDNHATIDPALRVLGFREPGFGELVETLRIAIIDAAARADRDIATTFVYAHPIDDASIERLAEPTTAQGGIVHLVQLCPTEAALEDRIVTADRKSSTKISDLHVLRSLLEQDDLSTPHPATPLRIDNTTAPAQAAAAQIGDVLGLRRRPER